MISFRFVNEIQKSMDGQGINKAALAERIGTSKSYITQLFRGDKVVNMAFLAKAQKALGIEFKISI